jgi:hypothetical protein
LIEPKHPYNLNHIPSTLEILTLNSNSEF